MTAGPAAAYGERVSKAFTSEEPADEVIRGRQIVRAARGQERPVTASGYASLLQRREALEARRSSAAGAAEREELEHALALATAVLESVRVVDPGPPDGTVRFGSQVGLSWDDGRAQRVVLVGPDEADGAAGRVSIEAPLARVLLGHRVGDEVEVTRPRGTAVVRVVEIS